MLVPCDTLIPLARASATVRTASIQGVVDLIRHRAEMVSPIRSRPMLDEDASFLQGRIVISGNCALSTVSHLTQFLTLSLLDCN